MNPIEQLAEQTWVVECPSCLQKNRVKLVLGSKPKCGRCSWRLSVALGKSICDALEHHDMTHGSRFMDELSELLNNGTDIRTSELAATLIVESMQPGRN